MSFAIANTANTPISNNIPCGSIMAFLGTTDPAGWVIMDGVERINNTDSKYNGLSNLSIGTGGSGTTNYTPPNYKGAFLRGTGTSSINTNCIGPSIKSSQDQQLLSHTHTGSTADNGSHTHTGTTAAGGTHNHTASTAAGGTHNHTASTASAGSHTHSLWTDNDLAGTRGGGTRTTARLENQTSGYVVAAGDHTHTVTIDSGGSHSHTVTVDNSSTHTHTFTSDSAGLHSHTVTINSTGGSDLRPVNYGVNWIIKL
jgi:microcystin-dependent protein